MGQVSDIVVFEAGSGRLSRQLFQWVVQHDLVVILQRQLEYEVQEGCELIQLDLDLSLCVGRAENADAEFDLLGHRASAEDDERSGNLI